MTVGVLALQGDVREHLSALAELGEATEAVRRPEQLDGLAGLVIPGGESTTLSLLLESSGLFEALRSALAHGLPVFGTCAGMILLATDVLDGRPDQQRFGAIDLSVRRNGYGRQQASFECDLTVDGLVGLDGGGGGGGGPVHAVFIRAPLVVRAGDGVEVLASLPPTADQARSGEGGHPVVCRQGQVLVSSFHPELTGDRRLHELFVTMTKAS
jgi:5'-phosphate synthase pdxT subunit